MLAWPQYQKRVVLDTGTEPQFCVDCCVSSHSRVTRVNDKTDLIVVAVTRELHLCAVHIEIDSRDGIRDGIEPSESVSEFQRLPRAHRSRPTREMGRCGLK